MMLFSPFFQIEFYLLSAADKVLVILLVSDIGVCVLWLSAMCSKETGIKQIVYIFPIEMIPIPIVLHLRMVVFILPGIIREMDVLFESQLYGLVL